MKKKLFIFSILAVMMFGLSACSGSKIDLKDYIIEERTTLYTASDSLYNVSLSTGMREQDYNLDGIRNEMVEFGVLTISRNDSEPLANDNYYYTVTIGEEILTGSLIPSQIDNSYTVDLERKFSEDSVINVEISFTGYTFNEDLTNTSQDFSVDLETALEIANQELASELSNMSKLNPNIEVVTKILKDYSSEELKRYYWYVGVISGDGDTLGLLIDANSGEVIAKKV